MKHVKKAPHLKGHTVLVRAALNVPIENGKVSGTFRLRKALPTIQFLQEKGARVVLLGHLGDTGTESLRPVYDVMKPWIPLLEFCETTIGRETKARITQMHDGDVIMLENVRRLKGEKENDPIVACELAELADLFVQDSFDVCHRMHASVVGVAEHLPSYAGFLVEEEVQGLSRAFSPKGHALAIIAGSKFSTKEPVLHALLEGYDRVFVAGALANDLLKAKGYSVGDSLVSDGDHMAMQTVLDNPRLLLPVDAMTAPPSADRSVAEVRPVTRIDQGTAILDVGPATIKMLIPYIEKAKTVLWNGTLGKYENGFIDGTEELAKAILRAKPHSIVGGGDTVAALDSLGLTEKFSFVSTGGGAMLDFLANGSLPGIDVLNRPE